jgi:competence protein ComEC
LHSGTAETNGSYFKLGDAGKINLKTPLRYYGRLADEPEKLPWGVGYDIELSGVDLPGPPSWVTIIFLITLAGIVTCLRLRFAGRKAMLWSLWGVLAAAGMVIATYPFSPQRAGGKLELTVLDVGQGDSLFVVSPTGKTLLIDGGGAFGGFPGQEQARGSDPGEEAVSPYLWSRGFKKIDVVALTHGHQDHLGGLHAILENFRIGRL